MDNKDYEIHLEKFVASFIKKPRRERWKYLLKARNRKTRETSHKMHNDIDRTKCSLIVNSPPIEKSRSGVFYNFSDEPECIQFAKSYERGIDTDAIFSIEPGKLAIFFFHEGEEWFCER